MVVPRNKKQGAKNTSSVAKAKPSRKSLLSKVRPYILGLGLIGVASGIPQIHSGPKDQPRGWIEKIADKAGTKKTVEDVSEFKNQLNAQIQRDAQNFDAQLKNATPDELLAQENRFKQIQGKYNLLYAQLENELDAEKAKSAFNKKNLRFQTPQSFAFGTGEAVNDFNQTKKLLDAYKYRFKKAKIQNAISASEFQFGSHVAGQTALKRIEQDKQNAISQGKTPAEAAAVELKGISYYLQTNRFRDKDIKEPSKEEADSVRKVFDILAANPDAHSPDVALTALDAAMSRLSTYKISGATKKFYAETYADLVSKIASKVKGELGAIESVKATPDGGLIIKLHKPPGFQFKSWKLRDHGGTASETEHFFHPINLIPIFNTRQALTAGGVARERGTEIPLIPTQDGRILITPDYLPDENGHSVLSLAYGYEMGAPKGVSVPRSYLTHDGKFTPVVAEFKNGQLTKASDPVSSIQQVLFTGAGVGTSGSNDFPHVLYDLIQKEKQKHPDKAIFVPMDPIDYKNFAKKYPDIYKKALAASKITRGFATQGEIQNKARQLYGDLANKFVVIKKVTDADGRQRVLLQTNNSNLAPAEVTDVPPELVNPELKTTEFGTPSDLSPDELKEIEDKPAPSNEQQGAPTQEQAPQEELPEMPHDINTNGDQDFQGKLDFRKANEWKKFASATEMRPRTAGVSPFSKFGEQLRRKKRIV